jgi:hypothetical protein
MHPEYTGEWAERASAHEGWQSPSSSETSLSRASCFFSSSASSLPGPFRNPIKQRFAENRISR